MGMSWQFFSVESTRWNSLFDGSLPDAKKHFAASAIWSQIDTDLPDPEQHGKYLDALWRLAPPKIVALAEHVARHGITYRGLSNESASLLDAMVVGFFSPEGLEPMLNFKVEHSHGISLKVIEELLSRSRPTKIGGFLGLGGTASKGRPVALAQWLITGRRFGTNQPTNPEDKYFILDSDEVEVMRTEVRGLLAVDRVWGSKDFENAVREELLAPLERVAAEKKYFAARYT